MKKTISINLGSTPFVIDDDAYETLSYYLHQIEIRHGRAEDMSQIENRLAYMLSESDVAIINAATLRNVMAQFGTPDQFGTLKPDYNSNILTKRLYRNRKDKIIAGVCGGLAKYFEIDPVIVRIVALILLVTAGIGIIPYLILWIAMPNKPLTKPLTK